MLDNIYKWIIALIIAAFISIFAIDSSQLTHYAEIGQIVDKWHEESCIPMFDGNGGYIGESCGDDYTIVLMLGDRRVEEEVLNSDFKNLKIGDRVNYQYDLGKLNIIHNKHIETITAERQS
jgi:hypothetical protein